MLVQYLEMSASKPHGSVNKFSVEVRVGREEEGREGGIPLHFMQATVVCVPLRLFNCALPSCACLQLVMEYVGGGNVSSFLRNPDSSPVLGSVSATTTSKQTTNTT